MAAQVYDAGTGEAVGAQFTVDVRDHNYQAFKAYPDGSVAYPLVVAYRSVSSASTRRWHGGRHVRMASHYVVRCVDRAEPQTIAALRDAGVATAHEAAGRIGLSCPATLATTS
jgi:hypothetical protein